MDKFIKKLGDGRGKRLLSLISTNKKNTTGSLSENVPIINIEEVNDHDSSEQDENWPSPTRRDSQSSTLTGNDHVVIKVSSGNGNLPMPSEVELQPLSNVDINTIQPTKSSNLMLPANSLYYAEDITPTSNLESHVPRIEVNADDENQPMTTINVLQPSTNVDNSITDSIKNFTLLLPANYLYVEDTPTLNLKNNVPQIEVHAEDENLLLPANYLYVEDTPTLNLENNVPQIELHAEDKNLSMSTEKVGLWQLSTNIDRPTSIIEPIKNSTLMLPDNNNSYVDCRFVSELLFETEKNSTPTVNDMDGHNILNTENNNSYSFMDPKDTDEDDEYVELTVEDTNDKDYEPNSSFSSSDSSPENCYEVDVPIINNNEINNQTGNRLVEEGLVAEGDEEITEKRRSRKKVRDESMWARNVKKIKLNKGETYKTKSGRLVGEKTLKPGCGDKCRLKCSLKIDGVGRQKLLDYFLILTDANRKRDFVSKLIEEVNPKYRYKRDNSLRSLNYNYHFIVDGKKMKVCKKMFCDTFVISATYLTTVKKKTLSSGIVEEDLRGRHKKQFKVAPEIIRSIHDHINSFVRIESHYCRANTQREFIDGDLSLSEMYRLYKSSCIENGVNYAKKHKYEEIFNTEYNIGFFIPKKDQCSLCESFKNSSDEEKIKMEEEMKIHLKEKELSRAEKKNDKDNSKEPSAETVVACFDLQAVIQLPKGQISTFYYKRKLNVFNFTIYDATSNQGHCYIWHEGCAKRGAVEIASFLFDFLKNNVSGSGKKVIFYSDNCSGQNKNHILLSMYLEAVKTLDIPSITHKYLIVGHTQNEGDTMHSSIERQLRKATNKTPLYVPSQLVAVVQMSNREKNQFNVKQMDTEDIYDWEAVENSFPGKNFQYSILGDKVIWANVKVFEVRKSTPLTVFYKNSYEQEEMMSFNLDDKISKKKDGSVTVVSRGLSSTSRDSIDRPTRKSKKTKVSSTQAESSALKKAYQSPPGISAQKKIDLLSLCSSKLIPTPYHEFFKGLKTNNINNDE